MLVCDIVLLSRLATSSKSSSRHSGLRIFVYTLDEQDHANGCKRCSTGDSIKAARLLMRIKVK